MKFKFQIILYGFVFMILQSCKKTVINNSNMEVSKGLIVKESPLTFNSTYDLIRERLENNPNLKIILELDHSKNAVSKGLSLRPTRLLVFGNPNLGTPLMQLSPSLAIDLPQKIAIYQEGKSVFVTYNDPMYLQERHQIKGAEPILEKISNALDIITKL